ncbi:MAG: hypothetical protein ACLGQU_04295 [Acidobacteriota bacterium]
MRWRPILRARAKEDGTKAALERYRDRGIGTWLDPVHYERNTTVFLQTTAKEQPHARERVEAFRLPH